MIPMTFDLLNSILKQATKMTFENPRANFLLFGLDCGVWPLTSAPKKDIQKDIKTDPNQKLFSKV